MEQKVQFNMEVLDAKPSVNNPGFTAAKIRILYTKHNRNNSYFTEESVNNALPTIYNVPIIGEYIENKENFGGHGGKIEIENDEIKFIQTTIPYGVVPSDAKFSWEDVVDKDGVTRRYLVADGCLLWSARYPELDTLLSEGKYGQSMEIEVNDGQFAVIDGKETFRIDSFNFTGLCILGVNTENDPNGHVEPCFEGASIMTYGLDTFKANFNEMMQELNFSQKPEGGSPMAEPKITEEQIKESAAYKLLEKELEESKLAVEAKVAELDEKEKEFAEAIATKESNFTIQLDAKNAEYAELELKAQEFEAQVAERDAKLGEMQVEFDGKIEEFTSALDANKVELEELRSFKATTEESMITEKFSSKLEADIISTILSDNKGKTVAEVEGLLFAEIGKQNFSQKKQEKEFEFNGVNKPEPKTTDENAGAYNGLFELHGNKQ